MSSLNLQELTPHEEYVVTTGKSKVPRFKIMLGNYKGLVFDLLQSGIMTSSDDTGKIDEVFEYKFSIVKVWNDIPLPQVNGTKITLTVPDQEYMHSVVLSYIKHLNSSDSKTN